MTELVGYLLLFTGLGVFFLFIHLVMGSLIRPKKPDADKLTIYECGEPTIGSAWIQFDLRFYVVALLFVIFDVEVAFFFPWAVVFGKANTLADKDLSQEQRLAVTYELDPVYHDQKKPLLDRKQALLARKQSLERAEDNPRAAAEVKAIDTEIASLDKQIARLDARITADVDADAAAAHQLAWFAFWDILVFFGVLLVGFAYLWKRGDLDWVRSTAAEKAGAAPPEVVAERPDAGVLTGAGRGF